MIEIELGDLGIGPRRVQRRLERDAATPGSGLGLSLVAAVVRLHHGRLELRERSPGLAVTCIFAAVEATA